ncbi:MAG: hypothetical protein K6A79_10820 [Ruminococcus sp.]|jgi:hypothetical protein|nr:hypothetical protein [Ruminococcus sp.]MCR5076280.1 hypothetical protein [Ruminococcus sp.]
MMNIICAGAVPARIRFYRHRPWTAKDFLAFGIGFAAYIAARYFLPKIFPALESKLCDRISLGIAAVFMILTLFVV